MIGSGIGGCVTAASSFSANPSVKVLLLEAGPRDDDADIHNVELTSLFAVWQKPQFDWGLSTVEEPGLDGRKMPLIQGKVAGGGISCTDAFSSEATGGTLTTGTTWAMRTG